MGKPMGTEYGKILFLKNTDKRYVITQIEVVCHGNNY
jgi:hypothetical protein